MKVATLKRLTVLLLHIALGLPCGIRILLTPFESV